MKIAAKEVDRFLADPKTSAAVLIYGPDRGQVRQRADAIAAKILTDIADPFNRADLSAEKLEEDPARLADELAAMSFTGDRRLIMIREATDKIAEVIQGCVELLNPGNYLILCADDLGPRSPLRLMAEAAPQIAALPCYKDEGVGLSQLIRTTLRGYGFQAEDAVIHYLSQELGGDRMIILSELEKLALYFYGETRLNLDAVAAVVSEAGEKSFDDVAQAVASGQIETLCRALDRLFMEGEPFVAVLRSVQRYFSRLAEVQALVAQGQSVDQAVKSLRPPVFFKQQPMMIQHARRWTSRKLDQAQYIILLAEKESKLAGDQANLICSHHLIRIARAA